MKDLFSLAAELQHFFLQNGWRFCFIGGLALQRWGENRITRDIDLVLMTGFGHEVTYVDHLLANYTPRREDAREFALQYRVLLLKSNFGIGIDISLAALQFEEEIITRATDFEFQPGVPIRTCSSEDLVVLKAFASRPQDWVDIRGILIRQKLHLARGAIINRLSPLVELKEEPQILDRLQELYREIPSK